MKPARLASSPVDNPARGVVALLAALAAIGALSTNIILPSFPAIAAGLGASDTQLSLTLSVFFIVFAAGQLVVGPISDRFGRRKLVIGGLLIFAAGGVVCAQAAVPADLIIGRGIQAAGVCAAAVLARAIARDLYEGETLARVLAMVIVAMAAAPGFSPLLGGMTERIIGWRMTFLAVSACGVVLAIWYAFRLRETYVASQRVSLAVRPILRTYCSLLIDPRFLRPVVAVMCLTGGLYGFFAAAPSVLMGAIKLSALEMGLFFAATVPVVFATGLAAPWLSHRWGAPRIIQVGIVFALVGGGMIWLASVQYPSSLAAFTFGLCVFLMGMGVANPLSTALALSPFGAHAGAASAMLGFMQMSGAALGAMLVNAMGGASHMAAVGLLIAGFQMFAWVVFWDKSRTATRPE
ncbi:MFS transporter, DHA1 family, bicyclomycin/chloramphenicol resistance protein [Pseudomonas sp. 8Z]|uniref:Bcr/CflA family efflux MFS transporter n=1 Tax=Pseudomonas sp. 8Z TaxID=2653166 RepID=UPI0012F16045|nr:Bcr/CflA family efflux MFS transporter [Pseudomonas sp. 8Z]VXC70848.1 MFS transporter, DHA1 family, bicyclomycin/chloramphenicol resistance protein [Pseudomonas sp. 8Z]